MVFGTTKGKRMLQTESANELTVYALVLIGLNCSPKFGQVAKIEERPKNEQQKGWRKAPAAV
jgi:hypothetical protein